MSSLTCCIWWLVFGVLLGWLLSWWLSKFFGNKPDDQPPMSGDDTNLKQNFTPASTSSYVPPAQPEQKTVSTGLSRADMLKAAGAAGFSFSGKKSDLEIIEGIGPKIAELLNNSGIHTFEELSRSTIGQLNGILEQGGERFKLANPETWAQQAALAAENRWPELKALQDSLHGGNHRP